MARDRRVVDSTRRYCVVQLRRYLYDMGRTPSTTPVVSAALRSANDSGSVFPASMAAPPSGDYTDMSPTDRVPAGFMSQAVAQALYQPLAERFVCP
jgi:hypothetical protein